MEITKPLTIDFGANTLTSNLDITAAVDGNVTLTGNALAPPTHHLVGSLTDNKTGGVTTSGIRISGSSPGIYITGGGIFINLGHNNWILLRSGSTVDGVTISPSTEGTLIEIEDGVTVPEIIIDESASNIEINNHGTITTLTNNSNTTRISGSVPTTSTGSESPIEVTKTVTVGSIQGGAIEEGEVSLNSYYEVTTENIRNGRKAEIRWFSDLSKTGGASVVNRPPGINILTTADLNNNSLNLPLEIDPNQTVAGDYYFTVVIEGIESSVMTLTVSTVEQVITNVSLTGFIAPETGEVPIEAGDISHSGNYTVTSLTWTDSDNLFLGNKLYVATIELTSNPGYKFSGTGLTPPPHVTVNTGTLSGVNVAGGDVSGNTLTFTVTFPKTWEMPVGPSSGQSLTLDGVNQYADASSPINSLNALTIMAWINPSFDVGPTKDGGGTGDAWEIVSIAKTVSGEGSQYLGFRIDRATKKLQVGIDNGTGWTTVFSSDPINDEEWNHVAVTIDSFSNVTLYINAENKGSGSVNGPLSSLDKITFGALQMYRSSEGSVVLEHHFKGHMNEVQIWDKALSLQEIRENILSPPFVGAENLKGFWLFNDGVMDDLSGQENHGEFQITFLSLTANGEEGSTTDTLTLTFDREPIGIGFENFQVVGADLDALQTTGDPKVLELTISNISVENGENITVNLTNPTGLRIVPSSREVVVYKAPTSYTYYRWVISEIRDIENTLDYGVQASQFQFFEGGVAQNMSAVVKEISGIYVDLVLGEVVDNLIDGDLETNWFSAELTGGTPGYSENNSIVTFELHSPRSFTGYRWATGYFTLEQADPKSWRIEASNDGVNWIPLHEVSGYNATDTRSTWQPQWIMID